MKRNDVDCSAAISGLSSGKGQLTPHKLNTHTQFSNENDVFPKPLTLDSCRHLAHGLAALV